MDQDGSGTFIDPSDLSPPRLDGLGVKGSTNRGLLTLLTRLPWLALKKNGMTK